jgi:hypothetical protein
MNGVDLTTQVAHVIVALTFGWGVLTGYRWIRRRSAVLGTIVATTILIRGALGLVLFWTSYLVLPFMPSLQEYGGFWTIALDATGYYQYAAAAVEAGMLYPLDHVVPAPFFIDTLAIWMMGVGISPASAILLNLCLYVGLVVLLAHLFDLTNDWRHDLPCLVGIGAYSFSPVTLMHSTQPLKEELFGCIVAVACLGVLPLRRLVRASKGRGSYDWAKGGVVFGAAVFAAAGVRWYYACILGGALALTLAVFSVRGRTTPLPRYLGGSLAIVIASWIGFWGGAGPGYRQVVPELSQITDIPSELINMAQVARVGFLRSGGNSNIVVPLREDTAVGQAQALLLREREIAGAAYQSRVRGRGERLRQLEESALAAEPRADPLRVERELAAAQRAEAQRARAARQAARMAAPQHRQTDAARLEVTPAAAPQAAMPSTPTTQPATVEGTPEALKPPLSEVYRAVPTVLSEQMSTVGTGLAIVFVPITLVRGLLNIDVPAGRGMLAVADLDTVYMDVTILAVLSLLWTKRRLVGDRIPFVLFALVLSGTTAILLGYVVTNFGTLSRMRPLVAIPLWVAVVALSPRIEPRGDHMGEGERQSAATQKT